MILFDLAMFFGAGWHYSVLILIALSTVLYATSYRRAGKWYDWRDARLDRNDEWKYIKGILIPRADQANQCANGEHQQQKEGSFHNVRALDRSTPPRFRVDWRINCPGMLIFCVVLVLIFFYFLHRCFSDEQSVIRLLLSLPMPDGTAVPTNDTGAVLEVIAVLINYTGAVLEVIAVLINDNSAVFGAVLVALTTAAAAVMTIFMTVRQNTRSVNRQAWINSIRELMASLIAGVPRNHAELAGARKRHRRQYSQLALYLNPSEKAHRGFLYAIAVMYGAEHDWPAGDCPPELASFDRCGASLGDLVQGLTHLSNVVLKMEWEQVKKLT